MSGGVPAPRRSEMSPSFSPLRPRAAWTVGRLALGVVAAGILAACQAPAPQPAAPVSPSAPGKKKERLAPGATPTPVATAPAPPSPPLPPDLFKVYTDRAAFYANGPQQPGGPSLSLKRGDRVTLLKRGFGFSQVKLADQQVGYIGTEDLAKVTPEEYAAEQARLAPPIPASPLAGRSFFRPGGVPRPQLPPSIDADLPRADGPAPKPEPPEATPKFRY